MLIHAFISSRIDYCYTLFSSLSISALDHLQTIQNGSNIWSHITPILKSLHWLPVAYRIQFKILTLTYRALHGQASTYVAELLHPYSSTCSHRSNMLNLLSVPCTRLKTCGDQAFEAVAPKLWNAYPYYQRIYVASLLHIGIAKWSMAIIHIALLNSFPYKKLCYCGVQTSFIKARHNLNWAYVLKDLIYFDALYSTYESFCGQCLG